MDFLTLATVILPDEAAPGSYFLGAGRAKPHESTRAVDTLAEVVTHHAIGAPGAADHTLSAHWSLAKFENGLRRRATCVATRAIVFDVDYPEPIKPDVASIVATKVDEAFVAAGLPSATLWFSTSKGVHGYWCPFTTFTHEAIEAVWLPAAQGVRHFMADNFPILAADASKTTDRTAFIRMPLTLNTKNMQYGYIIGDAGSKALVTDEQMLALALAAPAVTAAKLPHGRSGVQTSLGGTVAETSETKTIRDPAALLTQCSALSEIMRSGVQSYTEWFAAARLFTHSEDLEAGHRAFHTFSSAYATYDAAETAEKFRSALEAGAAAPTCLDFRRPDMRGGTTCDGCPMKKTDKSNGRPHALQHEHVPQNPTQPASLTSQAVTVVTAGDPSPHSTAPAVTQAKSNAIALLETSDAAMRAENDSLNVCRQVSGTHRYAPIEALGITLPTALQSATPKDVDTVFICPVSGGLTINTTVTRNKKPESVTLNMCKSVVWPDALIREKTPNGAYHYGVKMVEAVRRTDQTGTQVYYARTINVPAADVHASPAAMRTALASARIPIVSSDARGLEWMRMHKWMHANIINLPIEYAETQEVSYGWRDLDFAGERHFVLGDRAYAADSPTRLVIQAGSGKNFVKKFDAGKSLVDAFSIVRDAAANATPEMMFLMAVTLGTPLLALTNAKGLMVNIPGETGMGKTAVLSFLNSFYCGARQEDLAASGGDTMLATMHIVGIYRNIPVMVDEVTLRTEEEIGAFLMQLTQGQERNRMEASSNALREANTWATIVISSSNKPIGEMIASHSDTAEAQRARVLEIYTDTFMRGGSTRKFVEDYVRPMHAHGSLIGAAFVKTVLQNFDATREAVKKTEDMLKDLPSPLNASTGDKFRLWRAAATVAIVATDIANRMGLWDADEDTMQGIVDMVTNRALEQHTADRIDPIAFISSYVANSADHLVIPQVLDASGVPITQTDGGYAPAIAAGRDTPHIELTMQVGVSSARVVIAYAPFMQYCEERSVNIAYVEAAMERLGMLDGGVSAENIGVSAGVGGRITGGPAAKNLMPGVEAITVHMPLKSPFVEGRAPKYATMEEVMELQKELKR